MDILYEVYKTAMSYTIFIFKMFTFVLGVILLCCFIIDKEYKLKERYGDRIKRLEKIKEDHMKLIRKNKMKEV